METEDDEVKSVRYAMIVQLASMSAQARILKVVPEIVAEIDRISGGEKEFIFKAEGGQIFGFFFKTRKQPHTIRRILFEDILSNANDAMVMFEVGPKMTGRGFSRAWTWLQHH